MLACNRTYIRNIFICNLKIFSSLHGYKMQFFFFIHVMHNNLVFIISHKYKINCIEKSTELVTMAILLENPPIFKGLKIPFQLKKYINQAN